jgi:hypothetical protein
VQYLAGQSVVAPALREALRRERQPLRAAAALQLTLLEPEAPYFDVGARATFQRQLLAAGQ